MKRFGLQSWTTPLSDIHFLFTHSVRINKWFSTLDLVAAVVLRAWSEWLGRWNLHCFLRAGSEESSSQFWRNVPVQAEGKAWVRRLWWDPDMREADPGCQERHIYSKDLWTWQREKEKAKGRRILQSHLRQTLCLEKPLHGLCSEIFFLENNIHFARTHKNKKTHMKHIVMVVCVGRW